MTGLPDDRSALDECYSSFYVELRHLAQQRLRRCEKITLLDTTALVHESYLKFLRAGRLNLSDRGQFLAYAAHVMRSIIVDFVRKRRAGRRGGDEMRVAL